MGNENLSDDDKRKFRRLRLDLPIQARLGAGDHLDLDIVDISATGMQVRTETFDVLKNGFDAQNNEAIFEIRISARLTWARPDPDGTFVTGWEFNRDEDEPRIG
ncbi:MAG: PilZ domain-containing protein [bacterium]|nr:PilZ domain-containing protein [bacterium]